MGTVSAAGTGLKVAASGVSSMLGGPLGMALGGATVAMAVYGANVEKTAAQHRQIVENAKDLGSALATSNGAWTAQTQAAAAASLENQKLAGTGRSLTEYLESVGVAGGLAAKGLAGSRAEMDATLKVLEQKAAEEAKYQREVGSKDLSWQGAKDSVAGIFNYKGISDKKNEARNALADFQKLNDEAQRVAGEQRRIMQSANFLDTSGTATELGTLNGAMRAFAESTGGAADKIGILASGLSSIRGDQMSTEDAQQRVNNSLRNFSTALANGGAAAVDAGGKIDTATTAGDQLYSAMKGVQSAFDSAGAAAGQAAQQQSKSQEEIAAAARNAGQKVRDEFINQAALIVGTRAEAEALANQYGLFPDKLSTDVELMTSQATTALNAFVNQPRTAFVDVQTRINVATANAAISGTIAQLTAQHGPGFATGGRLPTTGPGTGVTDGFLAVNGAGAPIARVDAGEWVINGRSSEQYDRELAAINAGTFPKLPGYAEGGKVNGIQAALNAGRTNVKTYLWGGTGPGGWDCSGWVGWLQQIVMGASQAEAAGKRLYTTYSLLGGSLAGLRPGLGPAGTQFQVGVSQEHMAATIAGLPAESGGSHGDSRIGAPAVGATDSQFTNWFYLPNDLVAGGVDRRGIVSAYEAMKNPREWTSDDEDDLTEAHLRVRQEEESLSETQTKLNEGKATQVDLDRANLDLKKAQKKVLELQKQKDSAGAGQYIAPEAPGLAKRFTDSETERLEAQMALDEANDHRNEVYDNPESSERDRLRADIDLSKAEDALDAVLSGKNKTGQDYSLRGIAKTFLDRAGDSLIEGVFGQIPFGLGESRWVTTDWKSLVPEQTFSKEEIEKQLPVTRGDGDWVSTLLDTIDQAGKGGPFDPEEIKKRLKVYDSGGWLEPGEMAINLSSRPEPIFNSPDQLRQFAGDLQAPASGSAGTTYSINMGDVTTADVDELIRKIRLEQKRQSYGFNRR
ncbi:hypothetical protein P9209_22545 [Prescottella defluvii]|nr:hypothetical protein P9209_22545 [Prescottella defluvii]